MSNVAARPWYPVPPVAPLPTIIVVSADDVLRAEMETVIAACDHVAIACADGWTAIDRIRKMPVAPSLILLDWTPYGSVQMSGHEFLARLATQPRDGRTPVVVVASHGVKDIPRACVSGILRRPVSAMSLIETIAQHARRTRTIEL
jgi:CheY-like chemotaxis protein